MGTAGTLHKAQLSARKHAEVDIALLPGCSRATMHKEKKNYHDRFPLVAQVMGHFCVYHLSMFPFFFLIISFFSTFV